MNKSRWIACLTALLVFTGSAQAQNVIEALPGEEIGAPPVPTPEAYEEAPVAVDKSWMTYTDPYLQAQRVISNPHRTAEEVSEWFKGLAADLMTHSPDGIIEKVQGYRHVFSENGYREYVTYMRDAKVLDMVNLRKNELSTIANGDVVFVSSGAVSGVYTWSAALPLLISFYQIDERGNHSPVAGGNFRIEARITRSSDEKAPEGMVIDSWRITRISNARP
ncbi:MAG: DotI/IcmL/TraM family protein [Alphaproteobacteria bacterium]